MRPAAATIWKYLLEREQSPEGVPLFMKFYVGRWEREREREGKRERRKKRKKKNGWKGERKQQKLKERERGVRTWSDSGWKKGVGGGGWSRKRKDAGWKRTEGKEACKVAFRLSREKHRPRRIGVNGVSPRGNSIGYLSRISYLVPLFFLLYL